MMRVTVCFAVLGLCTVVSLAEGVGKIHMFKRADLPKTIKAKASDRILIVEDVRPADVEELMAKPSNANAKVRAEAAGGEVRIIIDAAKKGKVTVEWRYETPNGKVGGHKGLEIEIE
jgi:hypothetical protein